jgi:hypothetical protein
MDMVLLSKYLRKNHTRNASWVVGLANELDYITEFKAMDHLPPEQDFRIWGDSDLAPEIKGPMAFRARVGQRSTVVLQKKQVVVLTVLNVLVLFVKVAARRISVVPNGRAFGCQ